MQNTSSAKPEQGSPEMAVLDVRIFGRGNRHGDPVSLEQSKDAAVAFSLIGYVIHQPTGVMLIEHEGKVCYMVAHSLRVHVEKEHMREALDAVQAYREMVLPEAMILAEVANISVVSL